MRILNFFAPLAATTSWTFILAALFCLLSPPAAAAAEQRLPAGTINISFNVAKHRMTGTARITLPPATPLALQCGPAAPCRLPVSSWKSRAKLRLS
ncbi:MAG: hypothetical protein GXP57_01765 [Deltaproteobacteria bacterium]|nr:hypothetical protein [Deltaproteobacteria bacterium]